MRDSNDDGFVSFLADQGATCQITYVSDGRASWVGVPEERRKALERAANEFLDRSGGDVCVLLLGPLQSDFADYQNNTENAVTERCISVLGEPGARHYKTGRTVDLVLDTLGGSLDSAFKTVLFLSRFTSNLRVFVPRRAKSAGTLIAIGTQQLYMTPFSELGPLDTQIRDPRNPTETLSALDCYQSVDYVRKFGLNTLRKALALLGKEMQTGIPLGHLLNTAEQLANASTEPMLSHVEALDFGGWGRTLQIGEMYAQSLLRRAGYRESEVTSIAAKLVYGYTHHPFPIDITEAQEIGLTAKLMKPDLAENALQMVRLCTDLDLDVAVGAWETQKKQKKRRIGRFLDPVARRSRQAPKTAPSVAGNGLVIDKERAMATVKPMRFQSSQTGEPPATD